VYRDEQHHAVSHWRTTVTGCRVPIRAGEVAAGAPDEARLADEGAVAHRDHPVRGGRDPLVC
jgi:hypothetical protein